MPTQAECDPEYLALRDVGFFRYAQKMAMMARVLQDCAAQDGRVLCHLPQGCGLPLKDSEAIQALTQDLKLGGPSGLHVSRPCAKCVEVSRLQSELKAALVDLHNKANGDQDFELGLQPLVENLIKDYDQPLDTYVIQ